MALTVHYASRPATLVPILRRTVVLAAYLPTIIIKILVSSHVLMALTLLTIPAKHAQQTVYYAVR